MSNPPMTVPAVPPKPSDLGKWGDYMWDLVTPEMARVGILGQIDRVELEAYCRPTTLGGTWTEGGQRGGQRSTGCPVLAPISGLTPTSRLRMNLPERKADDDGLRKRLKPVPRASSGGSRRTAATSRASGPAGRSSCRRGNGRSSTTSSGRSTGQGTRKVRTALVGVPRKNGKSTFGAALALYVARSRTVNRAPRSIRWPRTVTRRRSCSTSLQEDGRGGSASQLTPKITRHWIEVQRVGAIYRVLSADAPTKHGLNPHGVIFDELHAQPRRELWDVMTSAAGARRQPLTLAITTAGYDRDTICWEQYDYGRKVEAGVINDPSFLFRWWGADEDEAWDDPAVWKAANPNYRGVGRRRGSSSRRRRRRSTLPAVRTRFGACI